jgi:hypothetical protein
VDLLFTNGICFNLGFHTPKFENLATKNKFYPSILVGYQPTSTLRVYLSYENASLGAKEMGKTSSFEIGFNLTSFSRFCDGGKYIFFQTKRENKIKKFIDCPDPSGNLKGKIQSF